LRHEFKIVETDGWVYFIQPKFPYSLLIIFGLKIALWGQFASSVRGAVYPVSAVTCDEARCLVCIACIVRISGVDSVNTR
jgi:hypothetical protein